MFKNRMLRKIAGSKRDAVTVNWRRLHNGEIYDLYSSPIIIRVIESRRMRGAGCAPRMVRRRGEVGKPEGKKSLGRPRYRWILLNRFSRSGMGHGLHCSD